ncbi:MAG: sensor histidine kinase [Coprococcus sp.]|nr:sensor histidine kinase [Coprococcus sp.]
MIDHLDFPKIWYSTLILSSTFLVFNILAVPISYSTLHTGRLSYLFPLLEGCAFLVLTAIYLLFYWSAKVMLEQTQLKERSQLLEIQSHQYYALQEHIRQTARLRHDFRHSVHLLALLAEQGDLSSIRTHLTEYETRLTKNAPVNYCRNAALNALFSYYHELALSKEITVDWNIALPDPLIFSELDLAALFGNLMENAVAGCLSIPEESRFFNLTTELHHGGRLYIVSTNSFDGNVLKVKDGYRSTKHSGKGIGLASITAIAEKYDGTVRASNNDKEFFVDVFLKIRP